MSRADDDDLAVLRRQLAPTGLRVDRSSQPVAGRPHRTGHLELLLWAVALVATLTSLSRRLPSGDAWVVGEAEELKPEAISRGLWDSLLGVARVSFGGINGPMVVVFGDYQCPACSALHEEMERVPQGGANFRVFHAPLPQYAQSAAAEDVAECALSEGRLLSVHAQLYSARVSVAQGAWEDVLPPPLAECAGSGIASERIRSSTALARTMGVHGTPTLVVDGRLFRGVVLGRFQEVLDASVDGYR